MSIGDRGSLSCPVMSDYQWIRNVSADTTQGCDGTHGPDCVGRMEKRNEILTIMVVFPHQPFHPSFPLAAHHSFHNHSNPSWLGEG